VKKGIKISAVLFSLFILAGSCIACTTCTTCSSSPVLGVDLFPVKDLPLTRDANFSLNLMNILDGYRYTENYSAGRFDCMDTCIIASRILHQYGYDPNIMASFAPQGKNGSSHMWLSVSDGLGRFAFIETCAFARGRPILGELVTPEESAAYASGYVLTDPIRVMQCFGYSEDRFLFLSSKSHVETTAQRPIVFLEEGKDEKPGRWVYQ